MALLLFFMLLGALPTQAQISFSVLNGTETKTTPALATSYTSMANMLTALNAVTAVSGDVAIQANSGSETAPAKGFTIGSTSLNAALSGSSFKVYIYGSYTTINAGVGTATPASGSPDGMIKLVGADNIELNEFLLIDGNTTNPATMEFGIGLFKASATDGCNNNIIHGNEIRMQRTNFTTSTAIGIMPSGATAIIMVNSIPTVAITQLTPTTVTGANSNNVIRQNYLINGNSGIHLYGYNAPSPYTLADSGNIVDSNTIYNFGGGATAALNAYGIYENFQWNTAISNNNIDNNIDTGATTGTGVNTLFNLYGIYALQGGANSDVNIIQNTIKLQSGSTNSILGGILNAMGTGSGTTNINDNKISLGYANATTGSFRAIQIASAPTVLNINNNIVEGIADVPMGGTAATSYAIGNGSIIPTVNTNTNIIRNFDRTGASGTLYGIQILATNWNASGNTIDNLKFSTAGSTGTIYGLYAAGTAVNSTLNSNTIKNIAIPFTGAIYGISENGTAGQKIINSNQIFNFTTSTGGTGGSNFYGVYCLTGTTTIGNNSIYSLIISGNNASAGSSVTGIHLLSPTNTIFNNKIYDLSANSIYGSSIGFYSLTGNTTLYNNVISDLRAPNAGQINGVNGILLTNGSASLYNNTVLLNETVKNTGNSGSTVLFFNSTGTLISRNNIFINTSAVNGTGKAVALYINNYATVYDTSSNNNLLNANTIFSDGTNSDATLAAFKTRMVNRDQASVTEATTPFTSTVGSNAEFLRLATNAVSVANNAGVSITSPAITTDYWGVTRNTSTPDIGASEFTGYICVTPAAYTLTGGGAACAGSGVAVGLSNSESFVNYQLKLNGTATGTAVAGTGAALSFPNQTLAGTYTVDAVNSNAACPTIIAMTGSAIVAIDAATVGGSVSESKTVCNGANSGLLSLTGHTGTVVRWERAIAPFTNWTTIANATASYTSGALTQTIQYRAVVKSGTCLEATSAVATITVTTITATKSVTNVSCNGGTNGTATVSPLGGTAPYTYSWNTTPAQTNATATGLVAAGNYTCTITDNSGCFVAITGIAVTQPTALAATTTQINVSCNGGTNGTATVVPSGGTVPYTYSWNTTPVQTTNVASGLAAGTYSCTITDANSCSIIKSFIITQPPVLNANLSSFTNVSCNTGANGSATITATGGTAAYTYSWNTTPVKTTATATGLAAGVYSCTVTDVNGCTTTVNNILITKPTAIIGTTVVTNVSCNGGTNGYIDLTTTGGVAPYTYNWGGGITTEDRTGLAAGTYSCVITDANSCTKTVSVTGITITQPAVLVGSLSQTNVSCNGGSNGSATITPSGGTSGYTYLWSNGATSATATGLVAGTYSCTITDNNGCIKTVTGITITQPSAIDATVSVSSGVITANQTGASYQWIKCPNTVLFGESNSSYTPTASGDYKVDITLGCTVSSVCVTMSSLGTQNLESKLEIAVYPNPSSDVFFIESKTNGIITVNDLNGKIIQTQKINSGTSSLDLGKASNGVYLLKITNDNNESKTVKLIKQ